ncbi:MAG: glycosyltransferase family 2 protein [Bacteroides sp.]|nr:glycosyltransferase family 2 protein [Ruminococcus flavefaciens]MCM1554821.1 glycosyltransferase family 2 protein [Bacteroides sp.]
MKKLISILTPCYNEEENIPVLCQRVREVMAQIPQYEYEHIFIDNASKDNTVAQIRKEIEDDKRIRCIVNIRNFGQSNSPFYGIRQCYGDAVIFMVADLQDPPEKILEFVKKWEEGSKVVMGVKNKSKESRLMFFLRKVFYSLIDKMSDVEQVANYYGFGLYDREFVDMLRQIDDPNPYFRGLVNEMAYDRSIVYYEQPVRLYGKTKNNFFSLYHVAMLGFVSYSKIPLRLASFVGMAVALVSFLIGLVYLVYKLIFWDSFQAGQAPLVIGIFFLSAVQLIFIGVIGEYIGDIQSQVKKRPLVIEKTRINFPDDYPTSKSK